ncbi:entericidin A/B family lipoprotein [Luteolibacter sp. Populi]|uniref:entericidin A/B family lipoprotein n=1 Tax=Luteolibacter sp. Populi TaxID=3230487 RepID=UPI003467D954
MNPILLLKSNACRLPRTVLVSWPACFAAVILLGASLGLNSCGTARGLGSDIQKGGEKIEEAASR